MPKQERDPGRGQLRRRSARAWRDQENPTGPGQGKDEPADEPEASVDEAVGRVQAEAPQEPHVDEPVNAGPGGGGATESAGRAKHHEGLHG
ncbi:MAG: hypothetical protein WD830_00135, partial [Chloroflexota bacterium]